MKKIDTPETRKIDNHAWLQKDRVFSQELKDAYEASGFKPVAEKDIHANKAAFHEQTMDKVIPHETRHSYYNHKTIWTDYNRLNWYKPKNFFKRVYLDAKRILAYKTMGLYPPAESVPDAWDKDGNIMPEKARGPAIILGSGPSLDPVLPMLKDWKGGLVVSTSQATSCLYFGADPTHIVCFDCLVMPDEFNAPWHWKKTALISHPGIHPSVHELWKGQKLYYRIMDPNTELYNTALPVAYPEITTEHYPFAASIPAQMALARRMGYDPLILVGADYSWNDQKARFTRWDFDKRKWWQRGEWIESKPGLPSEINSGNITIKTNSGRLTQFVQMYYRKCTMVVQWLDGANCIDCSDGTLTGLMPRADIKEVIATQGECLKADMKSKQEIRDWLEPWLSTQQVYWLPMDKGWKLVDVDNFRHNMPRLLDMFADGGAELDREAIMAHCFELEAKAKAMNENGDYGEAGTGSFVP